jgi:arginine decarboxylase
MTNTLQGSVSSSTTQTYADYLQNQFGSDTKKLNAILPDFLYIENNHLFCHNVDLAELAQNFGSPLEVGFAPLVTHQVQNMYGYFASAFARYNYQGQFTYAYASKAAQYEDLIRTALKAGAHYETSSPMDIIMAGLHWKAGNLPNDRFILANGFKTAPYVQNIVQLRREGFNNIIPIIESEQEIDIFAQTGLEFEAGIRMKVDETILQTGDFSQVTSRFGVAYDELDHVAARINSTPHMRPVMLHAMIGTQCEDMDSWVKALLMCFRKYCELNLEYPTMRAFNFGGGMPVPYSLNFKFDYQEFADKLVTGIMELCAQYEVAHPEIIGEFGRYTAASYGMDFYKVVVAKPSHREDVSWYVIDGSLMSSLPDTWGLNQQFIILPLSGYDRPAKKVWLAGLTCDSDDVYKSDAADNTVVLPDIGEGEELIFGVFMTGAYQDMLSGIGGVHHCLLPEPSELVIEATPEGYQYTRNVPSQSVNAMAALLGYDKYLSLLNPNKVAASATAQTSDHLHLVQTGEVGRNRYNSRRSRPRNLARRLSTLAAS